MAQAEKETKKISDSTTNVLALNYLNTSTIEKEKNNLLKGITQGMQGDDVKMKIIENLAEQIGMTKNEKGQYLIRNRIMDKKQMLLYMLEFHRDKIQELIELSKTLNNFEIEISKKNIELNNNAQKKIMFKQKKENIKNNWKKLSKELNITNRKLIDAAYKQGRIESGMRNQLAQVMFQKQNIGSKFQNIRHNFNMAINNMNALNIINDSRARNAHVRRSMINNHNDKKFNSIYKLESDEAAAQAKLRLLKEKNDLLKRQLQENLNLRDDLKKNVLGMIDEMRALTKKLDTKLKSEQEELKKQIAKLAEGIKSELAQAADNFNADLIDFANDIVDQLDNGREKEKEVTDDIIIHLEEGNRDDRKIIDVEPVPVNRDTGLPPECGVQKPDKCAGDYWQQLSGKYINRTTNQTDITIFRCMIPAGNNRYREGDHFCASDHVTGLYVSLHDFYKKQ